MLRISSQHIIPARRGRLWASGVARGRGDVLGGSELLCAFHFLYGRADVREEPFKRAFDGGANAAVCQIYTHRLSRRIDRIGPSICSCEETNLAVTSDVNPELKQP